MQTAPLTVLDELYLHLDREGEPFSVHIEIRVEGHIDVTRLHAAVREAALRHPIARARLAHTRATDVRYHWEIADELASVDLEEIECDSPADLTRGRERLLSRIPDLDRPGPFSLLLAHDRRGDVVVMNLHHGAGDGLSAVRLMASIARAYSGEEDPVPDLDALDVRDVSTGSVRERITRGRTALEYLPRWVTTPARIAPQGYSDRPGYGFELLSFEPEEVEQLLALRTGGATVNDVLLAGLAVAVHRWNEQHGASTRPVYLMMPVNLRPPEWRFDILGNFAAYVSVRLAAEDQKTLAAAIQATAASTRRIKNDGIAKYVVDFLSLASALPTGLKRHMQKLIPLTGNAVVDTAVLSNLGRLPPAPHLGDAGAVQEVWFSPPGRMPLGASLGAATLDGRLFLTLRYRHALFDANAAAHFLATFRRVLAP
ncbi:MAG: condensation domain-containing protein [Solirubrobacteraceae bacterium]